MLVLFFLELASWFLRGSWVTKKRDLGNIWTLDKSDDLVFPGPHWHFAAAIGASWGQGGQRSPLLVEFFQNPGEKMWLSWCLCPLQERHPFWWSLWMLDFLDFLGYETPLKSQEKATWSGWCARPTGFQEGDRSGVPLAFNPTGSTGKRNPFFWGTNREPTEPTEQLRFHPPWRLWPSGAGWWSMNWTPFATTFKLWGRRCMKIAWDAAKTNFRLHKVNFDEVRTQNMDFC